MSSEAPWPHSMCAVQRGGGYRMSSEALWPHSMCAVQGSRRVEGPGNKAMRTRCHSSIRCIETIDN